MNVWSWLTGHRVALIAFAGAVGAFLHATGIIDAGNANEIAAGWAVVITGATLIDRIVSGFVAALGSTD